MTPTKLTDKEPTDHVKILGYGMAGTGKTFAGGTMPGKVYVLLVGNDNEIDTLTSDDFVEKHPEKVEDISFDVVSEERAERGHFKEATAFDRACDTLDEALEKDADPDDPFEFDSLVIDNATTLNRVQMNKAISINHQIQSNKNKTTLSQLREENIIIPGDNDYMSQMSLMEQFIDWLFGLDKHVFVVAHEYRDTTYNRQARTQEVDSYRPLFTGKHRENIPLMFDNVWRFYTSGKAAGKQDRAFKVRTQGSDKIMAKTRLGGVLRNTIRDINLTECIEKMQESQRANLGQEE